MGTSASHNKEVSNEVKGRWPLCMYSVGSLGPLARAHARVFLPNPCTRMVKGAVQV